MWLTVYGVLIQLSIIIECRYIDSLCREATDMCRDAYNNDVDILYNLYASKLTEWETLSFSNHFTIQK